MKTLVYIVTCAVMLSVISCTSRNKGGDDVQVLMKDSTVISAPQRMQVSDTKVTITYKGREYRSSVVRRPDESLPVVTNEQGERFIDNSIALRITCGGKQIVDKVFTKESFASLVDARFLKYAILEGLVYDKTTPQGHYLCRQHLLSAIRPLCASPADGFRGWQNLHGERGTAGRGVWGRCRFQLIYG